MLEKLTTEGCFLGLDSCLDAHLRQPSDQNGDDHGVKTERQDELMHHDDVLFSPAEHTDGIKRRKQKKRQERRAKNATPRMKNTSKKPDSDTFGTQQPEQPQRESRQGTPPTPRPPKSASAAAENEEIIDDEDVWYAKWWMFCFPDTANMTQKR